MQNIPEQSGKKSVKALIVEEKSEEIVCFITHLHFNYSDDFRFPDWSRINKRHHLKKKKKRFVILPDLMWRPERQAL